jgi:cyclopropane fatty-acyl-phospholipid synthase-like methyltransferase
MAQPIADRLRWAVEILQVQPDDCILEIGSGHGLAVTLICDKLINGKITALDQSEKMIQKASKRNSGCIASGKMEVLHASLQDAKWERPAFDKVFAVHVNVFWMKPPAELKAIKTGLKPNGKLFLFYQPIDPSKTDQLIGKLIDNLQSNGFQSVETFSSTLSSGLNICVTGQLS